MESITLLIFVTFFVNSWRTSSTEGKVFMVLLGKESAVNSKTKQDMLRIRENTVDYKERIRKEHDYFLESLLGRTGYTKLYSYSKLLNGFAVHVTNNEMGMWNDYTGTFMYNLFKAIDSLQTAEGIVAIQEDVKIEKLTTYTPEFLGIPDGVWPNLGGAKTSGAGVVIGLIDTGINYFHPSFSSNSFHRSENRVVSGTSKFKGECATGDHFPQTACNGKIVGAQYFAKAAVASGQFNVTRDYASPFDADGHGSHTASIAAGNYRIPVLVNNFNYGYASGMAPGASIAVYKAMYAFGGYMSDVVAAVEQAVEDGVDILSLSVGPSGVPSGRSSFLNVLEVELLFAAKEGVLVVQAAGNGGPSPRSMLSFSPWIMSVASSLTDRKYNNSIELGNGQSFVGIGLSPPTLGQNYFPLAAAADVGQRNTTAGLLMVESCQSSEQFVRSLVRGKLVICSYTFDFESEAASIAKVADTMYSVGAAGFIMTMNPDIGSEQIKGATLTLRMPGIILSTIEASSALWRYYQANTIRSRTGTAIGFRAAGRILDGRKATYTRQAPVVAAYSSRGPDVNNALLETADVLKPNIMAPGSSIWAAWSPQSEGDEHIKGQNFAILSGTSMATPHIAGIAALIKHKHPDWSPAVIASAMMTTANVTNLSGAPILAQQSNQLYPATPFDFGAGAINPSRALDPGLAFDISFKHYVQFLCSVPGIDDMSVSRAVGVSCPTVKKWCSDLNTPSVTVSNLVGKRKVTRRVTNVGGSTEKYSVAVRGPLGVTVAVRPRSFKIRVNASRHITIYLSATQTTNAYTFGQLLFHGDKGHLVRVPLAVYVASSIG